MGDKYLRAKNYFCLNFIWKMFSARNIQMFKYGKFFPFGFFYVHVVIFVFPDIFLSYHHCNFSNSWSTRGKGVKAGYGLPWLVFLLFSYLTLFVKSAKDKGLFWHSMREKIAKKGQLFIYFLSKLFERGKLISKAF